MDSPLRVTNRTLIQQVLNSPFLRSIERVELDDLLAANELATEHALVALSHVICRIRRRVVVRRDAYRPLDILC